MFIIYSDELDKNDGGLKKLMGDACHALGKIPASGSVNKNIRSLQVVVCPCKCRTTATAKIRRRGEEGNKEERRQGLAGLQEQIQCTRAKRDRVCWCQVCVCGLCASVMLINHRQFGW